MLKAVVPLAILVLAAVCFTPANASTSEEFIVRQDINCTGPVSCSYHGDCASDKKSCRCDSGWWTEPQTNPVQCNYEQKSQLTAFLLEFFLGWEAGAGNYYVGDTKSGNMQVCLFWAALGAALVLPCLLGICAGSDAIPKMMTVTMGAWGIIILVGGCINIYFWVEFIKNTKADSNGVPLKPW
jgi:hypothetical protein